MGGREQRCVLILVTMTDGDSGPGLSSDIYRSDNNGKTFIQITHELGEKVYIRRENGLQRHQNQRDSKELFVICYDIDNKRHSVIFVTKDGGYTWEKSNVPFVLSGQLRFYPRKRLSPWILTLEEKTSILYLSLDNGKSWVNVHDNVVDFFWSIYVDDPEETFYVVYKSDSSKNDTTNQTLAKTTDFGSNWVRIMENVVRVWAPKGVQTQTTDKFGSEKSTTTPFFTEAETKTGSQKLSESPEVDRKSGFFLYVAHYNDLENQTTQLSVSVDGGKTFKPVFLPTVQPERFYSVLEVEDDSAFVHVDAPNDTGYGTLFVSDNTGQVFTESLRQHLYPNHAPTTDFYRVASMRGTYLATRLNPDRTLHTVITHNRGASWRALGPPLNVDGACKSDAMNDKQSTPVSTTFSRQAEDKQGESQNSSLTNSVKSGAAMDTGSNGNDSLSVDSSAIKVCGLQISNQFSIRNRVIAASPLSISAAPGLILAHGHVATHLKNTPADVFVSSDGGYTWIKVLDGPHHYQIANRGGLLVAVPADTLWPDVLRFSTDDGHCWHTIPLRTGIWTANNSVGTTTAPSTSGTTIAAVRVHDTTTEPPKHVSTTKPTRPAVATRTENMTARSSFETVVFTGLVTEPGGRAMAAAVYGYGTISQRWRVAVVDFITNEMVTAACTPEDYEVWIPHSSPDGAQDGCLLGLKQRFKRLKKDSLCINEYGMDPLLHSEPCPCTPEDFECEYGYYRQFGSLECVRNPHVPLVDPCLLSSNNDQNTPHIGYRRIPGNRCIGGWQPPLWNVTTVHQKCMTNVQHSEEADNNSPARVTSILLVVASLLLIVFGIAFYRRHKRTSGNVNSFPCSYVNPTFASVRRAFTPWQWKSMDVSTVPVSSGNNESLWPPTSSTARWNLSQVQANGARYSTHSSANGPAAQAPLFKTRRPNSKTTGRGDSVPSISHIRPSFMSRFRQNEPDSTNLLDAEEVAFPTEPSIPGLINENDAHVFHDPLTAPSVGNTKGPDKGLYLNAEALISLW
ncbi:sortilin [Paragonimus westermani]|uniref:Sortilin n=2 Tax=Paragonimus westermani TaxID=34504 RepID=A0A5J4NN20_9TREM|nr:sortilin [Paragonimus westermani]